MTGLSHILKGIGGEFELGRVLWALMSVAYIIYQGADVWVLRNAFNPIEFGTGAAAILAAGGFGIAAKDKGVAKATAEAGGQ